LQALHAGSTGSAPFHFHEPGNGTAVFRGSGQRYAWQYFVFLQFRDNHQIPSSVLIAVDLYNSEGKKKLDLFIMMKSFDAII
jgi:hypothetical protein